MPHDLEIRCHHLKAEPMIGFAPTTLMEITTMVSRSPIIHLITAMDRLLANSIPGNGCNGKIPVLILAYLATEGALNSLELARLLGLNQATVSRATRFLLLGELRGRDGKHNWCGSVRRYRDPTNRSRFVFEITPKGERILATAVAPMSNAVAGVMHQIHAAPILNR